MMRAMLWKEYREHRAIWLAMAVVNGAVLMGLPLWEELWGGSLRDREDLTFGPVAVLLAWVYGMVCGSMMLAGERESATLNFLDALPVRRFRLWGAKGQIALLLLSGQVLMLCGWLAIQMPLGSRYWVLPLYALAMLVFGGVGLAYGLFFSARGENVLNAIGLTIAGQIVAGLAAIFLSSLVLVGLQLVHFWLTGPNPQRIFTATAVNVLAVLVYGVLTLGAIAGSARIFSRPDRLRGRAEEAEQVARPREARMWASWGRLLWLSYGQMRRLIVGLPMFALMLGLLLPAMGPLGWPTLTLIIGVLCGVTAFADEQMSASFRFLGDQRFPLGRIWIVKVGMRIALAIFAAFILLLPSLVVAIHHHIESNESAGPLSQFVGEVLHSVLVGPVVPAGIHLTIWLLYGFTIGHLCGLLFRKSIVAVVVALGMAALLLSLWIPSLLGIGLHFWQIASVPAILLLTAWLLVPAWAADRLATWRTLWRMGAALVAIGLWIAGNLWYRVAEIPDVPDDFDMPAFVARLPSMDDNKSGEAIRSAWKYINTKTGSLNSFPQNQLADVLKNGWRDEDAELGAWLDRHFQGEDAEKCLNLLKEAADGPLGVVEYVKNRTSDDPSGNWNSAVPFNNLLAARGLQLQARGDAKTFVDYLRIGLAMSRNMQNLSLLDTALRGRAAANVWPAMLDLWLEKLQGPPEVVSEQLKRVAAILRHYEDELPDEKDQLKIEYLRATNTLEFNPRRILEMDILRFSRNEDNQSRQAELDAASLMWRIPWERERHQRIARAVFEGDEQQFRKAAECFGLAGIRFDSRPHQVIRRGKRDIAALRASQLKAALRWYQAKKGKLPQTLDALVPDYLPAIPADPFDNQPFRYRLSNGEKIGWIEDEPSAAPPTMPGGAPGGPPGGAAGMPAAAMPGAMMGAPAVPVMPKADVFVLNVPEMPAMPGAAPGPGMPVAPGGMPGGAPPGMFDLPPVPTRFVPDGQGILWVVGEDGHDDGGIKQGKSSGTMFGEDMIFLVPPPPE